VPGPLQPLAVYEGSARGLLVQNFEEIGYSEGLSDKVLDCYAERFIYALFAVCAREHDLKIWAQTLHAVEDVPAQESWQSGI
jgi:hypothetical protein